MKNENQKKKIIGFFHLKNEKQKIMFSFYKIEKYKNIC